MDRVSLRDIATRAEVSVATVSMALRGKSIPRVTADRIRAIADEMGYRANPLLASLASKKFRSASAVGDATLAIFSFPSMLGNSQERSSYAADLAAEAIKLGYSPQIYNLTNESNPKTLFRELYQRSALGIVITGSMDGQSFLKKFDWSEFSVVQCARFHSLHPFHTVRLNVFQSIKLVFTQLRARGYSRIGFAVGKHDVPMEDDDARFGAAVSLENSYLPRKDRLPVYAGNFTETSKFLRWYDRWKPDAVVGFSGKYYWLLRSHGVRIPKNTAFASLHVDKRGTFAGVVQNMGKVAQHSIQLLDQLIRARERGTTNEPISLLISSSWHEGETVRPPTEPVATCQ